MAVVEAARNLAGIEGAGSTEFGQCKNPVVGLLTEWERDGVIETRSEDGNMGGTMRLGAYDAELANKSRVQSIYGIDAISERHRHRYEVNMTYEQDLARHGMIFSAKSPDGILPEIVELSDHPWFIGVQFHPELRSKPFNPHPLFTSFIGAAVNQSRLV